MMRTFCIILNFVTSHLKSKYYIKYIVMIVLVKTNELDSLFSRILICLSLVNVIKVR